MLQSGYITGYTEESAVSTTPQKRALNRYRKRLKQRGLARFEVLGLDADRELIRSLARRCRWRRKRVPVWRSRGSQVWGYALASGGRRNREEADCFLSQARLSSVLARGVR